MRGCEPKYRLAGLAAVGLCAVLLVPFGSHAAMQSCPADAASTAVDRGADVTAVPEADYIRLHWQVVAPPLYRELPLDAELRTQGGQPHHPEGIRPVHRSDATRNDPSGAGGQEPLKVACASVETVTAY